MSKKCTFFFDIDGTLFHYRKFETYLLTKPKIIKTTVNKLNELYKNGNCIVLTTARPEYLREHTIKELSDADINYHQLVMGIERGTRYLINDNEDIMINRAIGINVVRNKGLTSEQLDIMN